MKLQSLRSRKGGGPWSWIPTLYIAEGLPYFAVNTLTVLIYTRLGISKPEMAFYTGWLYLPWVIKPLWSPFVDIFSTKRNWVLWMQLFIAVCFALVSLFLSKSIFFASTLTVFWMMAFFSATHDISADGFYILALDEKQQAGYVGVRSTAYRIASVFGQGVLVIIAGKMQENGYTPVFAWQVVFRLLSILFLTIFLWHWRMMPHPASDHPLERKNSMSVVREIGETFSTFFRKPFIGMALAFMLLYRLPEAFCLKLVTPFLVDPLKDGGLALTDAQVGFANGTVGVIALLAGGIIGGVAIARNGLKKWIWAMALSLTLPCLFYCFLALSQPDNFILIASFIGIEQFGYGFGFTAYMMYMMYFCRGKASTAHYAFCTAFMALGMMLPGMAAGWIWEKLNTISLFSIGRPEGYINFFWFVIICSLGTFYVTHLVYRSLPEKQNSDE